MTDDIYDAGKKSNGNAYVLKYICHEPDWLTRCNSLYCLLQSTGLRLNLHCNENSRSRNERSQNNEIPLHASLL